MTDRTCSIDDCDKPHLARGWCGTHYRQWQRRGDPLAPPLFRKFCAVEECPEGHSARGYCRKHLHALYKYGDPLASWPRGPVVCIFDGCSGLTVTGGRHYCGTHYKRLKKYGDPRGVCLACSFCGSEFFPVNSLRRVCDECTLSTIRQHGMSAAEIAARDGEVCSLCDLPVDMAIAYPNPLCGTVDHIIPWSLGGTHDPSNLALAHFRCNARKGNRVA